MNLWDLMNLMPMTPLRTSETTVGIRKVCRLPSKVLTQGQANIAGVLGDELSVSTCSSCVTHVGTECGEDARETAHSERSHGALLDVAHGSARGDDGGVNEA